VKNKKEHRIEFSPQIILFLMLLIISSSASTIFSQDKKKPTRQSSMEAFSDGKYDVAFREFSELLITYPKDPLYKYYSGVSLIKLERDPDKAVDLLQQAIQSSSIVKSLPEDAIYYLARAQQMAGRYTDAVKSYNLFTSQAGKKAARELGVPELIQQCNNRQGEIARTAESLPEVIADQKAETIPSEQKAVSEQVIQKPIEKEPSEKVLLPVDYSKILDKALNLQHMADSLYALAEKQKQELLKLTPANQPAAKIRISETEKLAASYQLDADQKYAEANNLMNATDRKLGTIAGTVPQPVIKKDSVIKPVEKLQDTARLTVSNTEGKMDTGKQIGIYSYFEILPKPVTDASVKIPIDPEIPTGLVYRIQLAVFKNPVAISFFKGITPVYGVKTPSGVTIYYAGSFRRSDDAKKALAEVRAKGFKDSFIVSLFDGKSISAERAAVLEKEWAKKPFATVADVPREEVIDTIPPSLLFRVEVIRSLKPLKDDAVEGIKTVAGNRGLDIITLDNGHIVYLIGKFITFTSASEYADLLIRNGYREAKVAAWLGKKEIPVETARQLFENP
jgi:hypothetical protein